MNTPTRQFRRPKVIVPRLFSLSFISISTVTLLGSLPTTSLQAQEQPREIISDAFTKHRRQGASVALADKSPQPQSSKRTQAKPTRTRIYRLASSTGNPPVAATHHVAVNQLGITVWRLRPATANDVGAIVVIREKGIASEWVPERVEADTKFRGGDYVRLSIESPKKGLLYIVNRDLFADGTIGGPVLIYPWAGLRSGDNFVRPGRVIDIPAQEDNPSYFRARPSQPNQVGEVLTFIVAMSPLQLPVSNLAFTVSNAQMATWEKMWTVRSERFEMEGGAGEAWTHQEQQAASRVRARQLTRDDPAPQTIYRVTTSNKLAFMVNLHLAYK